MIIAVVILLYIAATCYIYGSGIEFLLQKITQKPIKQHSIITFLLGLIGVTVLSAICTLVIRINWEFQLLLLSGSIVIFRFVLYKKVPLFKTPLAKLNWPQKIGGGFLIACLLFTLFQAVQVPLNPDTGIYHAQTIHWIETYPAIPGLANLHVRLAYGSSWLLTNAVFSFSFLKIQSFHLLSGFLFLLSQIYFYQGIHRLLEKKFQLSNFMRLAFFLSTYVFLANQISSPGTDSPVTLLVWMIFSELVILFEKKTSLADDSHPLLIFILCVYCFTLKMSSIPILLLPIIWWIILLAKQKYRSAFSALAMALIIVVPFLIRNVIQTGYPVFPGFSINFFSFDWAVPVDWVKEESRVIHWFATLPNASYEEFVGMSYQDQISNWFVNFVPRYKAILLAIPTALALNIVMLVFGFWRKALKKNLGLVVVYFASLLGCLFWFLSAPAIRFGFGFLLTSVFLSFFGIFVYLAQRITKFHIIFSWLILCVCMGVFALNLRVTWVLQPHEMNLVIPADYPQWSSERCEFGNFSLLCQAEYDSCWYSPFPCAICDNSSTYMRGSNYREGFRTLQ